MLTCATSTDVPTLAQSKHHGRSAVMVSWAAGGTLIKDAPRKAKLARTYFAYPAVWTSLNKKATSLDEKV